MRCAPCDPRPLTPCTGQCEVTVDRGDPVLDRGIVFGARVAHGPDKIRRLSQGNDLPVSKPTLRALVQSAFLLEIGQF